MYNLLTSVVSQLKGDFVIPGSGYEKHFCNVLGWECINNRYYDATDGFHLIELKKGKDKMWFNMVRYAEIFLGIGIQNTVTVFFRYTKEAKQVSEIYVMDTRNIMNFLKMDRTKAHLCMALKKDTVRGLNMQTAMTAKDMREISEIVIYHPDVKKENYWKPLYVPGSEMFGMHRTFHEKVNVVTLQTE